MDRPSEKDLQDSLNEYGKKSDEELMRELFGFNIQKDEFESFAEMILPMLDDEQRKKLESIKKELYK